MKKSDYREREQSPNDLKLSDPQGVARPDALASDVTSPEDSLQRMVRPSGFPHIVSGEAAYELGLELVEVITAQGYVVVPTEEFVRDHQALGSDLWGQLSAQGVGAAIENLPSPLHRRALSQWSPKANNPFAARRSHQTPSALKQMLQEALQADCNRDKGERNHPGLSEQSQTKLPQK